MSVIDQISAALSVASLNHRVIASNIANRDSEGYQRLQVRFDAAMDRATVVPERTAASDPTSTSLEGDLVELSANSAQYEAMARVLSRYFSILNAITTDNRG